LLSSGWFGCPTWPSPRPQQAGDGRNCHDASSSDPPARLRCEVTRYVGRHGSDRVAKVVLLGAIPPLMLKTPANPYGTPIEAFDAVRAGGAGDRSQFYQDLSEPFYGANRPGMQVGLKGAYDCIKAFSETDLTQDLQRIDVPTLIVHGDDDQIVPSTPRLGGRWSWSPTPP
jgi:pimeloyl-ACP methyl ester carboxylesterase